MKRPQLSPLIVNPAELKKGETVEDVLFRKQIEYLSKLIDPSVFKPKGKK